MKKFLFLIIGFCVLAAEKGFCALDSVGPDIATSLKSNTAEPNYLSIVFALFFVIALIYITGLIYSKLNIASAKKLQEQFKDYDLSKVIVVSTTQLGQGKNLHVIELHKKRYLIGATQNSINLIKELDAVKESTTKKQPEDDVDIDKAIKFLYGSQKSEMEDLETLDDGKKSADEFDLHKKYL